MNDGPGTAGLNSYELRHLIGHLLDRSRIDDACAVLFAAGPSGESLFFEARDRNGDLAGFIADAAEVAQRAAAVPRARPELELKLALLGVTARNIAAFQPLAILRARLQTGFWGRDEAIRFASAQSSPVVKADALM